jgi:hypothetical protein
LTSTLPEFKQGEDAQICGTFRHLAERLSQMLQLRKFAQCRAADRALVRWRVGRAWAICIQGIQIAQSSRRSGGRIQRAGPASAEHKWNLDILLTNDRECPARASFTIEAGCLS